MRKQINYQQKQLHYSVTGKGPFVVLLHGFGEDSSMWRLQENAFPGYTLLIPDLPGSGASELLEQMRMEDLAQSVEAILEAENILECVMIGHSMGGYVTLAYAEKRPNRLKGFGLFHSTAFSDTDAKKETREKGIAFIKEHGAFAFLKTSIPNLFAPTTKKTDPGLIEEQIQRSATFTDAALIAYYRSMMERPDRTAVLKNTPLPVLFIMGRHDSAIPVEDGLQQCHLPALAQVHLLEAAGHMGMLEEPDQANMILREYLNFIYLS